MWEATSASRAAVLFSAWRAPDGAGSGGDARRTIAGPVRRIARAYFRRDGRSLGGKNCLGVGGGVVDWDVLLWIGKFVVGLLLFLVLARSFGIYLCERKNRNFGVDTLC